MPCIGDRHAEEPAMIYALISDIHANLPALIALVYVALWARRFFPDTEAGTVGLRQAHSP